MDEREEEKCVSRLLPLLCVLKNEIQNLNIIYFV